MKGKSCFVFEWIINNKEFIVLLIALVGVVLTYLTVREMTKARQESYRPTFFFKSGNIYMYGGERAHDLEWYPIEWRKEFYKEEKWTIKDMPPNVTATRLRGKDKVGVVETSYKYISDLYLVSQTNFSLSGENVGLGTAKEVKVLWEQLPKERIDYIKRRLEDSNEQHLIKLNKHTFEMQIDLTNKGILENYSYIKPDGKEFLLKIPDGIIQLNSLYLGFLMMDPDDSEMSKIFSNGIVTSFVVKFKDVAGKNYKEKYEMKLLFRVARPPAKNIPETDVNYNVLSIDSYYMVYSI